MPCHILRERWRQGRRLDAREESASLWRLLIVWPKWWQTSNEVAFFSNGGTRGKFKCRDSNNNQSILAQMGSREERREVDKWMPHVLIIQRSKLIQCLGECVQSMVTIYYSSSFTSLLSHLLVAYEREILHYFAFLVRPKYEMPS